MKLRPGVHPVAPPDARIEVRTAREGVAAKVGHDLQLGFRSWSGTIAVPDEASAPITVEVVIDLASLVVLGTTGGVGALATRDGDDIVSTAGRLLDVRRFSRATFRSSDVWIHDDSTGGMRGQLTLRGANAPLELSVQRGADGTFHAYGTIRQSALGIPPFKALFGALRLADAVEIRVHTGALDLVDG